MVVTTPAGSVTTTYDSTSFQLPPTITTVSPATWSTANTTTLTIVGLRFGSDSNSSAGSLALLATGVKYQPSSTCSGTGVSYSAACVLTAATSYTPTQIECTVQPGVGVGFSLRIADTWIAMPPDVGYAPPVVTTIEPALLPAAGGVVTVTGLNFGTAQSCYDSVVVPTVELLLSAAPTPAQLPVFNATTLSWSSDVAAGGSSLPQAYVACVVANWTLTTITCAAPGAVDAAVTVRVTVAGQHAVRASAVHYQSPAIQAVSPDDPAGVRTRGGDVVTLSGVAFPPLPWPVAVVVVSSAGAANAPSSSLCVVEDASRTGSALRCTMPSGCGVAALRLYTPLQTSAPSPLAAVSYAAPTVENVDTPSGRPLEGGFTVIVHGTVRRQGSSTVVNGPQN